MSLINQVLKDLDERRAVEYSEHKTELDDLHFAHTPKRKNRNSPLVVGVFLIVLLVVVFTGIYFYSPFSNQASIAEVSPTQKSEAHVAIPATPVQTVVATKPVLNQPAPQIQTVQPVETRPSSESKTESRHASPKLSSRQSAAKQQAVAADSQSTGEAIEEQTEDSPVKFSRSTVPMRPEQKAELAYQTGYDHLRAQRHRQAERSLRQALAVEQGHVKARELLSGIYIKQGRWIEASQLLREGLVYAPQHLTFTKLYARSLMQLNRDQQAITVLRQHAPEIKNDPNYFAMLAALYQRQNQHQQAADVYARLVTVNAQNGVWWVGLGISLEALGRSKDAVRAYGHARSTGNLHEEVSRFTDNRLLALDEINFPLE
jgi:MSHA biogenesis protein MshN